jgi:hypothetical protein
MNPSDSFRLLAVLVGLVLGYATGRYLWQRRRMAFAPWPIIAILAVFGLISLRLFSAAGLDDVWQLGFFPLLVGWGAGLSVTPARPPRHSAWWQVWRE